MNQFIIQPTDSMPARFRLFFIEEDGTRKEQHADAHEETMDSLTLARVRRKILSQTPDALFRLEQTP